MVERRRGARFLLEAKEPRLVVDQLRREDLQRHVAVQRGVGGAVDLSHSSRTDGADDLVAAETGSGSDGHARRISSAAQTDMCHSAVAFRIKTHGHRRLVPTAREESIVSFLEAWRRHFDRD